MKNSVLEKIKGGLIVSCQALEDEPLHSPFIMGRMAYAAMLGGASGIRANSVVDIQAIRQQVDLPIIGIIKKVYPTSSVFITPTIQEIEALIEAGCSIIATDATSRLRPESKDLAQFFEPIRKKYPDQLFMADCSTYEEGILAQDLGFDIIGTTLAGYTEYTKHLALPNLEMIAKLAADCDKPVIAEGGIWSPADFRQVMSAGAFAAVVGTAITRPQEITKRYVEVLKDFSN